MILPPLCNTSLAIKVRINHNRSVSLPNKCSMNPHRSIHMLPVLHQPTIVRPDLLDKMRLSLHHKLTVIAAPPGYGKTTLVAQFAHDTSVPVAWQTVEEQERDLPNLVMHCLESLSGVVTDIDDLKLDASASEMETATLVTEHMRSVLSRDMVYVLDDVHHLTGSPQTESWLQAFIERIPSTCHIILIGRTVPSFPMQEMFARREVLALGQQELRFSFQEIQTLAHQIGTDRSIPDIQRILARLDGWAAGSVLALQPLPKEIVQTVFNGLDAPDALFGMLSRVMLHTQSVMLQDFLLASSTLTRMTPALCQKVLGLSKSRKYLAEALNRNLFVSEIPLGIKYHPLFRDFLQQHLKRTHAARFVELHRRAAAWFEENNQLEDAFDHYLSANRLQEAAAIAERVASAYRAQGKGETLLFWWSQLRDANIAIPQLRYICAVIRLDRYEFNLADEDLALAAKEFQAGGDDFGVLKVSIEQATLDISRGEFLRAKLRIAEALQNYSMPPNLHGYSLSILGTACLNLGEIENALQHLENALVIYRATGDAYALAHLLLTLENANMRVGRFDEASAYLQEAISIRRALGNTLGLVAPLNDLGYDQFLLGDYDDAANTFREGLQAAIRAGDKRGESYLLWSMGDLDRDRGAYDKAISLYQKALRNIGSHDPVLQCSVLVSLSTLYRWQGNLDEALNLAKEANELSHKHSLSFEQMQTEISIWAVRAIQGELNEARRELQRLATNLKRQQDFPFWVQTLALCASAALVSGDRFAASGHLKAIVEGVRHKANLQPGVAEIVHTPLLLSLVRESGGQFPTLSEGIELLLAAQLEPQSEAYPQKSLLEAPTYSLRVYALGRERVERDESVVPLSAWRAADAREMFFYLLLKGKTTHEQLGLILWQDSTSEQVRQKLHATLSRARKAVGKNAIQFEDRFYFINPDVEVWCDVVEFESLTQQARLASPLQAYTESLWRRAISLYQGELLVAFDANWIVPHREALHQMYLEALFAMGNCVFLRGNYQEAIANYQYALEIDSYREDIHCAIMTCYGKLRDRAAVERHLEMLKRLFEADLGISPSVETLALAQSLLT